VIVQPHSPGYFLRTLLLVPPYLRRSIFVRSTMGILSLWADTGRPPGPTMLLESTYGSCITIACDFCKNQQSDTAPNLYRVSYGHVTTYCLTNTAPTLHTPLTLHLPIQSSLQVISTLTCTTFPLAQQQQLWTPLPHCKCFNKQWLPTSPMKINNNGTPHLC
jgi:hypothetical protein